METKHSLGLNVVHLLCNYIPYIKFNTHLLHNVFYLLFNAPTCFGLSCWPPSWSSFNFFTRAAYASTYTVEIPHIWLKLLVL